jgi:hypothetical protein
MEEVLLKAFLRTEKDEVKVHDTPVTKLSKYYLDCLNFDDVGCVQSITILERLAEREFLQS